MISEEAKHKAVQEFKEEVSSLLELYNVEGLGAHIPITTEIITELSLQLHKRLQGGDHPIDVERAERRYEQRIIG